MEKVRIAVIDSGISEFQKRDGSCDFCFRSNEISDDIVDKIGHGTAIYYILNKYSNAEIINIKIFDEDETDVGEDDLIDILHYIYNNHKVDIVHLSMGVTYCNRKQELKEICEKITQKGTIIVSAFSNDGAISYPAAFENVIGVDVSPKCKRIHEYEYIESDIINIRAISAQQNLPWINGEYKLLSGSSFAAPHITAKIAALIEGGIKLRSDILENLKKTAFIVHSKEEYEPQNKVFSIEKAVVFPFNKEVHSLVRYQHLLTFKLADLFDLKYMRTINRSAADVMKSTIDNDFIIKNIDKIDWNSEFDTFIMGHVREINEITGTDYRIRILEKCLEYNKNIYAFDDLSDYKDIIKSLHDKNLKTYYPKIDKANVPKNQFGKLKPVSTPVLSIFGTSSRQGKYTLQLRLRELFINEGYKVGQLGTEPSAPLFGMDYVYPMGYDGVVKISQLDAVSTINDLLSLIDDEDPDVILTGSQSQTVPYATCHLSLLPMEQYSFLLGSSPDATILCINAYDDLDYIQRSIKYLESAIDSTVVGLVLTPVLRTLDYSNLGRGIEIISKEELIKHKEDFESKLKRKVFILNNEEDIKDLFNSCIEHFSS